MQAPPHVTSQLTFSCPIRQVTPVLPHSTSGLLTVASTRDASTSNAAPRFHGHGIVSSLLVACSSSAPFPLRENKKGRLGLALTTLV